MSEQSTNFDNSSTRRVSITVETYLLLLSLILVNAKAVYSLDISWVKCFLPLIIVWTERFLIVILSAISSYIEVKSEMKKDTLKEVVENAALDSDLFLNPDE